MPYDLSWCVMLWGSIEGVGGRGVVEGEESRYM